MRIISILALLTLPGLAAAQATGGSTSGGSAGAQAAPSAPAASPAPAASAAPAPAAPAAPAPAPRNQGFVVTDEEDVPHVFGIERKGGGESNGSEAAPGVEHADVPPVHVVRKGDTLWDICRQYFNNPWQWPKVWSYNPGITNPHWIFPGDRVHLTSASSDVPAPEAAPAPAQKGKKPRIVRLGGVLGGGGTALRELGFVEEGELKASAVIVGSREEKLLLSTGDQAYIEYPGDRPLHVGERYTVYKVEREVMHPITKDKLGYVVLILGEVQVDQVTQGQIGRATIVDSNGAIERGYRVGPLARRWKNVEARKNAGSLDGVVVSALRPQMNIPADEIVFVDRGRKDGVADGNRFFVVRRGDGYKKLLSDESVSDDPRYPKEVVAEILVVEAHDHTSVGYVSRLNKEVHPGDRIEMRRGY